MGRVFEAYEERMRRTVALKVLSLHLAASPKAARRFEQEAWIAGKLDHPNIVKVYDRGEWEGLHFYSMELISGGSLQAVIGNMKQWRRDEGWQLSFGTREYVQWVMTQVITAARALDYAHRRGVVHRDVKPLNLLLNRELGTLIVADFGLAIESEMTRLTSAGNVMGTLPYMSPEQMLGKQSEIDARTDVYALGVTLFELLTLEFPYVGESQQVYMNAVLTGTARRASKLNGRVGRDLEIVIQKALEKSPRDRYSTAAAFADDLENVLLLRPIHAQPPGQVTRAWKWARRKPANAVLIATLVIGIPTVGILGRWAIQRREMLVHSRIDALWSKVRYLHTTGRYQELIPLATEVLELNPRHVNALRSRALAQLQLSLVPATEGEEARRQSADLATGALSDSARICAILPSASWPHALRAYMLRQLHREAEARSEDDLATRFRGPTLSEDEKQLEASLATESGNCQKATDLLSDVIARWPGNAEAIARRGVAYEGLGQRDRAMSDFRVALGLNADELSSRLNLGRLLLESKDLKDVDEAERILGRGVELQPTNEYTHEAFSSALIALGRRAVDVGDRVSALALYKRAEREARESLSLNPKVRWALVNLGASLSEQQRLGAAGDIHLVTEADKDFESALSTWHASSQGQDFNAYVGALINDCDALIQLKSFQRALAICTRVTEAAPHNPTGFYNLAGVNALLGRSEEACAALQRDLELGDKDWQYLSNDPWFESMRRQDCISNLVMRMKRATGGA
jgi:tetratricopeptide (TPR) repeat protein